MKSSMTTEFPRCVLSLIRSQVAVILSFVCLLAVANGQDARAQWLQLGGPDRSFKVESEPLLSAWPEEGPAVVWSQEIGDGYSSVIVDGNRLYTMVRDGDSEVVICLRADTGASVWKMKYAAPFTERMDMRFGPGPNSTPLLIEDKIFAVGCTSIFHCLKKESGEVLWKIDLIERFKATPMGRGYSASPLAYGDTVILPVGGEGQGIVAFNIADGSTAWKAQDYPATHASPLIINFAGKDHLVVFVAEAAAGLDPTNGDLLWSHPHPTKFGANIASPVWCEGDRLFMSSAYGMGSRCIKLSQEEDGSTSVKELWANRKLKIHHANAIAIGEHVYGSSGDFGPTFLMGLDLETGEVAWSERGFAKATMVHGDEKTIILDEDGDLAVTTTSPEGLTIHARAGVLKKNVWSFPTLVGSRLYIRDRKKITAVELGDTSG